MPIEKLLKRNKEMLPPLQEERKRSQSPHQKGVVSPYKEIRWNCRLRKGATRRGSTQSEARKTQAVIVCMEGQPRK